MARIVKNGVSYTQDAAALTSGSTTIKQESGILESKASYVRGNASTGAIDAGVFKIFSGTTDPSPSLGQNGDIYLKRVSS